MLQVCYLVDNERYVIFDMKAEFNFQIVVAVSVVLEKNGTKVVHTKTTRIIKDIFHLY